MDGSGGIPGDDRDVEQAVERVISALLTPETDGPVRLADPGTAPAGRTVSFELPCAPDDGWLPFSGRAGEVGAQGSTLRVGLGPNPDVEAVRRAATAAGAHLRPGPVRLRFPAASGTGTPPGSAIPVGSAPAGGADATARLVEAAVDGLADGYAGSAPVLLQVDTDQGPARRGLLAADAVRLCRLLVSAPAAVLTPARAAAWATDIARRTGLRSQVLGAAELRAGGFGALSAIGAGSLNEPHLVRLTYPGPPGSPTVALVGKGITFDSGGLSLKSPAAMQAMRLDVAGAATVLAVMAALPRLAPAATVTAVLPFAENLPGPGAVRPGDVVTAWNGTRIQILDADFEGRVVLADALALAAADRPDLLVDLATLTYQAEIALGPQIAAVLARDDGAADRLLAAADAVGEPMWRLPWAPRYLDQVRTPFGVRNHPLTDTGRALTAALFLGEFVPTDVPWVHCDMTGPAWAGDASVDGGTGFGVRTLLRLLND